MSYQQPQSPSQSKDVLLTCRSTKRSLDSKKRDRLELYLTPEQAKTWLDVLSLLVNSPNGVKFDIHTGVVTTKDGSRSFDSTFAFCKQVQERPGTTPQGNNGGYAATRPVPSINPQERIAQARREFE